MAHVILVTGGSRSGKSAFAQKFAESMPGPRAFIATGTVTDDEMRRRIEKHKQARRNSRWKTIEAPVDLKGTLPGTHRFKCVVVDCLTLWINNLLYEAEKSGKTISENDVTRKCRELLNACKKHPGTVLFVTNEIGMGIVPEPPLCRLYRDLVGRCNQIIAGASDRVILLVAGQPLELKREARS